MKDKDIIRITAKVLTTEELRPNPKKKIKNFLQEFPGVIDTHQYKDLYSKQDRKRNGRYRRLPNIRLKTKDKKKLKI